MISLNKKQLSDFRAQLKRPYGGVTTFLPSEPQADIIRMSLLKNFDRIEERGESIWFDTGVIRNKEHAVKNTWAPVLIKHKAGYWLFLTHHILNASKRDVARGESDVFVEWGGGAREFYAKGGIWIAPEDYVFNDLGELTGGSWKLPPRTK